jgi:dynein light intermediate chain 1, cytosolic
MSVSRAIKRPASKDGEKQQIWVPMLNNASKGKDLAEKQLLVLGGTPSQQKEFLEHINPQPSRARYNDRQSNRKAPISNRYALGYTYQDILDADQEDVLARLNVYTLSTPSASFASLLKPLFSPKTAKDTLITILLDWSDPFRWARQLRQWIRLLRLVIGSLDDETKIAMEENMNDWKEKRVGPDAPLSQAGTDATDKPAQPPPLGPGEWDEGLGIPLSVVCIQSEKIETLERDFGWQDEQFDFLTQWLRCVLLKHGASLIYTASFDANSLRPLLQSSLSIQSLLKRETAKPNYIEREKILIPPNWDSWGKIRTLREGTELETISDAWSVEIQAKPDEKSEDSSPASDKASIEPDSAVALYESTLPRPAPTQNSTLPSVETEVQSVPTVQEFLTTQAALLESLKAADEKDAKKAASTRGKVSSTGQGPLFSPTGDDGKMTEHIGPYQINVNGIDFDAEEATRRLKEREAERAASKDAASGQPSGGAGLVPKSGVTSSGASGITTPTRKPGGSGEDGKASNEAMSAFFQNLIKKDRRGGAASASGNGTPQRTGSPAPGK